MPSPGDLLERILEAMAPYEARTFVLGFERPDDYERQQHESDFRAVKIALGEEIERRRGDLAVDFEEPELRIDVRTSGEILLKPAPLFIGGRYLKLSREIPATRWIHHACHGRGCASCGYTGNLCGPSIEELLAAPVLRHSGGLRVRFHGLGREDTDARMLGAGRPFVLEVHHPRRRTLPLAAIEEELRASADGVAEVLALRRATAGCRAAVKAAAAEKSYRAWIRVEGPLPADARERAERLAGAMVDQISPRRVAHRRGDGVHRLRRLAASHWLGEVDGRLVWEVRVESGVYVKELVSGDGGRTRPSLAEVLGAPCFCDALDVLQIHWQPPWEPQAG